MCFFVLMSFFGRSEKVFELTSFLAHSVWSSGLLADQISKSKRNNLARYRCARRIHIWLYLVLLHVAPKKIGCTRQIRLLLPAKRFESIWISFFVNFFIQSWFNIFFTYRVDLLLLFIYLQGVFGFKDGKKFSEKSFRYVNTHICAPH